MYVNNCFYTYIYIHEVTYINIIIAKNHYIKKFNI